MTAKHWLLALSTGLVIGATNLFLLRPPLDIGQLIAPTLIALICTVSVVVDRRLEARGGRASQHMRMLAGVSTGLAMAATYWVFLESPLDFRQLIAFSIVGLTCSVSTFLGTRLDARDGDPKPFPQ